VRVVVISSAFPPFRSPESAHTLFLCQRLAEAGLDIHLITSSGRTRVSPLPFSIYPIMRDWRWPRLPTLLRQVRRLDPDAILLIHLGWIYNFHPMVAFLPTFCRAVVPRARFVTQFENIQTHDDAWFKLLTKLRPWLPSFARFDARLGTLLSQSDRIILLAEGHLDLVAGMCAGVADRSVVIPAPPIMKVLDDPDGSVRAGGRDRLGVADHEMLLAFFGFIYPSKGIETLFRAMHRIPNHVRLKLVLIGQIADQDYGRMLKELERDLALSDRVIWVGHCDPEADEASGFLRAADVGVFPFDSGVRLNNSSVAVAAAHGLPLLTTAGADLEPQFRHGVNVWLCPPQQPEILAEAIGQLAIDAGLRQRLGAGALRLADDCFSWQRIIGATVDTLR